MRRSASEVIRNLEMRVARLEKQSSKYFLSQKDFEEYFGIKVTRKQYQSIMELMTNLLLKEVYKARNYTLETFDDEEIEKVDGDEDAPRGWYTYFQIFFYRWDIAIPFNGVIDGILKILGLYKGSKLRKTIVSSLEENGAEVVEDFFNENVMDVRGASEKMAQAMEKADGRVPSLFDEDFDTYEVELEDSGFDSSTGFLHLGFYFEVREEMSY